MKLTEGFGEEFDSAFGHGVVAPLPVENVVEETSRSERFDDHHDLKNETTVHSTCFWLAACPVLLLLNLLLYKFI